MINNVTLDEVLEGYAIETPTGNDRQILQRWIKMYPQFAAELTDFAAARAIVKYAPEEEFSAEEESRYSRIGLSNLRSFLNKKKAAQTALASLTDAAKEKGLNKQKFAAAAGISLSLLMYLEKKRLEFASIPKGLMNKLANVLETGEERIAAYLNQPPDLQTQASFKAALRPEEIKLKSFAEAVREDQTLSPEEKKKLLDLK